MCSKPIFCSKIALKGKTCLRLLKPQKVAPNAKSCSKVAEHNRDRPKEERGLQAVGRKVACRRLRSICELSVKARFLNLNRNSQAGQGEAFIDAFQTERTLFG